MGKHDFLRKNNFSSTNKHFLQYRWNQGWFRRYFYLFVVIISPTRTGTAMLYSEKESWDSEEPVLLCFISILLKLAVLLYI